ncbi:hypothetical protein R1flu_016244 [Riccia fluitans]|uniref:Uncharacterized protein n=1 Tax=Riccia fluitans TaxID=41844 RepID=A0ABD1YLH8_9MARC
MWETRQGTQSLHSLGVSLELAFRSTSPDPLYSALHGRDTEAATQLQISLTRAVHTTRQERSAQYKKRGWKTTTLMTSQKPYAIPSTYWSQ